MKTPALLILLAACSSDPAPVADEGGGEVDVVEASANEGAEMVLEGEGEVEGEEVESETEDEVESETETEVESEEESDGEPEPAPASDGVAEADNESEPAPDPTPTGPITYTLSPSGSNLLVQVYKDPDTVGAALSHDHVIAARGWTGQATWDPNDLSACAVSFTVPVARLDVDPPKLRASVGLEGELSDSQREEVKGNMLAKGQLWGDQHPNITFTSTGCSAKGDEVEVSGRLNIRGVDKAVRVSMKVTADDAGFTASGSFRAKATDFGFEPYSAGFGALRNKDSMRFSVSVKGAP